MEKLLNESNEMIKAKWKLRANLLRKAEEQKLIERENALNVAVEQYKTQHPTIAALEVQGEFIKDSVRETFQYTPSQEALDRIKAIEDRAYQILPKDIQTEMWAPDTCGCKLHRICKYVGEEYVCQTFETKLCEAHEGLATEEIHDVVKVENTSKNLVEGELLKDTTLTDEIPDEGFGITPEALSAGKTRPRKWKNGIKYDWSFSGTGKNRVLNVSINGATLSKSKKDEVKLFVDTKFGQGKVNI